MPLVGVATRLARLGMSACGDSATLTKTQSPDARSRSSSRRNPSACAGDDGVGDPAQLTHGPDDEWPPDGGDDKGGAESDEQACRDVDGVVNADEDPVDPDGGCA